MDVPGELDQVLDIGEHSLGTWKILEGRGVEKLGQPLRVSLGAGNLVDCW